MPSELPKGVSDLMGTNAMKGVPSVGAFAAGAGSLSIKQALTTAVAGGSLNPKTILATAVTQQATGALAGVAGNLAAGAGVPGAAQVASVTQGLLSGGKIGAQKAVEGALISTVADAIIKPPAPAPAPAAPKPPAKVPGKPDGGSSTG